MLILRGRCGRCHGNLFWDEVDGDVRCLACGAILYPEGTTVLKWEITDTGRRKKVKLLPAHTYQD